MRIEPDSPTRADVRELLAAHLADMFATSPPESVHSLSVESLTRDGVSFWSAREEGELLGCCAMTELDATHGELKSMRTAPSARRRGVGTRMLAHLLVEARRRGYHRVSLETGSQPYFAAARALYRRHGFVPCLPFADYLPDPNSVFMTRELASGTQDAGGRDAADTS